MKLRNMASVYITHKNEILLLYRRGSRVVNDTWIASAGGHFEEGELNSPRRCVEREMAEELGLAPGDVDGMSLRYITLRRKNDEIRQIYYYFAEIDDKAKISSSPGGQPGVGRAGQGPGAPHAIHSLVGGEALSGGGKEYRRPLFRNHHAGWRCVPRAGRV